MREIFVTNIEEVLFYITLLPASKFKRFKPDSIRIDISYPQILWITMFMNL